MSKKRDKVWDYLVSEERLNALIREYCVDYTALQREGRYEPITGRDKEINDAILIMLQKGRKNVCFIAGAGVGKTAMVVGIAQKIVNEQVPELLLGARVLEIDLSRMASGTTSKAEFQDRFLPIVKGLAERYHNPEEPQYILFFDEIHQIMPNCIGSSFAGLSDTLKSYLTTGDLMVIGATTTDEFRAYVAPDNALARRFQKINLKQPNAQETYVIMKALRPGLEKHHKIKISNENLMLLTQLTEEHMRERNQPDKTIITADSAMAYHVMQHGTNQELSTESIYYMVARETGLNPKAMHDEEMVRKINLEVAILEGEKEAKQNKKGFVPYDPSLNLQNVQIDRAFQAELAAEDHEARKRINSSSATDEEKAEQIEDLEERMASKVAQRLEETLEKKLSEKLSKDKN